MRGSPDVVVIGGGVIGLTAALELTEVGLNVEVCDQSQLGNESSWAGAGIIPPGNPTKAATQFDRLRAISSRRFSQYATDLQSMTGIDPGYRICGGIEVIDEIDRDVITLWSAEAIRYELLNETELNKNGLHIPVESTPFWLPDMAQIRNPRFLKALIAACEKKNVRLSPDHCVARWLRTSSQVYGVEFTNGERREAAQFVLAAGAWAGRLLQSLGCRIDIHPVRGQMLLFQSPECPLGPILVHNRRYVVPRGDGLFLVGSTEEPEVGFRKVTTDAGCSELVTFARRWLPDLRNDNIIRFWAGLRPGSPDGLPFIGFVPGHENVLAAVGHHRAGIQVSIGTAMLIRDLLLHRPSAFDREAFRLDRPLQPARKVAFRS